MKKLIIVAGASGPGKTLLIQALDILVSKIQIVKKFTSRSPRPHETPSIQEKLDLVFDIKIDDIKKCDYIYHSSSAWYGIEKKNIDRTILQGKFPLLIVRSGYTIEELLKDYPESITIYIHNSLNSQELTIKLNELKLKDISPSEREAIDTREFMDYINHLHLFNQVIINNFENDLLIEQIQNIVNKQINNSDLIIPNQALVFISNNSNSNQDYFDAIELAGKIYNLKIQQITEDLNKYLKESKNVISTARIVIFCLNEESSTHFINYFLGYAVSLNKEIIFCINQDIQLPPYLSSNSLFILRYNNSIDLQRKLNTEFDIIFSQNRLIQTNLLASLNNESKKDKNKTMNSKKKIFISYSHKDRKWLESIKVHFKVLSHSGIEIDYWEDTQIKPGMKWKKEINTALENAEIAILLMSTDFLASDFINDIELPFLLKNAEERGTKILSLILKPCRFTKFKGLSEFQSVNPPSKPLTSLTENERDEVLIKLCDTVEYYLTENE